MMKRAWLAALLAFGATSAGCSDDPATQVVTGQLSDSQTVAVRAVDDNNVVAAAAEVNDGRFSLALPIGHYRVEVLRADGVKHLYARSERGLRDLSFRVCVPGAPWDVGEVSPPDGDGSVSTCNPEQDPTCKCDPSGVCGGGGGGEPGCDVTTDPSCGGGGGGSPGCDPTTDPCKCDPSCGGGGGGSPGCDPTTDPCKCDPSCGGGGSPGCDPTTDPCKCDPSCGGGGGGSPGCDPVADPYCKCPAGPDDPNCVSICIEPTCWGEPSPPACDADGNCSAKDALMPANPPVDFGCEVLE